MHPRMFSRTLVSLVVGSLVLIWVPDVSAQRSVSRGGYSKGSYGRMHRQDPGEDRYRESLEKENDALEEELQKERRKRWEKGEEEEEETRGPSGGGACMYAADGTLVFAPRGKDCGAAANAAPPTPRPRRQQKAESSSRKPSGSCMMGADGTVLYAPAGVDCGQ